VRLDRDFAQLVRAEHYDIFLTPYGDSRGLYVHSKSPTGFEVREEQGGTTSVAFSYRVVAKRKDLPGPRLERVAVPERVELPVWAGLRAETAPAAPQVSPPPSQAGR
jgi:hypothetical protein